MDKTQVHVDLEQPDDLWVEMLQPHMHGDPGQERTHLILHLDRTDLILCIPSQDMRIVMQKIRNPTIEGMGPTPEGFWGD